jgi:hypothetical protein
VEIGECDRRRSQVRVGQTLSKSRERYRVRGSIVAVEDLEAKRLLSRLGLRESR